MEEANVTYWNLKKYYCFQQTPSLRHCRCQCRRRCCVRRRPNWNLRSQNYFYFFNRKLSSWSNINPSEEVVVTINVTPERVTTLAAPTLFSSLHLFFRHFWKKKKTAFDANWRKNQNLTLVGLLPVCMSVHFDNFVWFWSQKMQNKTDFLFILEIFYYLNISILNEYIKIINENMND